MLVWGIRVYFIVFEFIIFKILRKFFEIDLIILSGRDLVDLKIERNM